jgi:nicotinamide mononucleotide transporter PnuC
MTTPIAIASIVTWIKNPSKQNKNEVEVNEMKCKEYLLMSALAILVTFVFYFILKFFNTNNLWFSTLSITTSFLACYLSMKRSRFYALAYALNDVVLIVLWVLASMTSLEYVSMVTCFLVFLANDIYGFINWTKMMNKQKIIK